MLIVVAILYDSPFLCSHSINGLYIAKNIKAKYTGAAYVKLNLKMKKKINKDTTNNAKFNRLFQ